jgi:hypothetical protein
VLLGASNDIVGVYENDGTGHFTDRSADTGIPLLPNFSGVVAGDYDRDGDLDLYITRWGQPNVLLRNDGDFAFTDVTDEAGVGDAGQGTGAAWGDFNNDGWLDLYVPNYDGPNRLYRNQQGSFFNAAGLLGVDRGDDETFQASFFDYDRDGDADLYLATSHGQLCDEPPFVRNHLFENIGGGFIDVTDETNTAACVDAMCIGIGDFDNSGYHDLYVTGNNVPGNVLLMHDGEGAFDDVAEDAGVLSLATGWGSMFFDYDNDGWLDLYVCNAANANRLYRYNGAFPFEDVSVEMNVDDGDNFSYSLAQADIDNDGDLDMLLSNRHHHIRLFINHEGEHRHWAKFDIVGRGASRYAVGATIDVRTGDTWRLREVIAGCNYKNQNDLIQHVGVNEATVLDEVVVTWLGGTQRVLMNLEANQTWTLYPPDKLGDADGDGDRDLDDFLAFVECVTGDVPGALSPGCEVMDYQGDADVDVHDFDLFIKQYDGALDDCNGNGEFDLREIVLGDADDVNANGVPDTCECLGDMDGSGSVGVMDLLALLGQWHQTGGPADFNVDGIVDEVDLFVIVNAWGDCS